MEKSKLTRGSSAGQNYIPGMALNDILSLVAAEIANLKESENTPPRLENLSRVPGCSWPR
jgi:hypothetical protein